MKQSCYYRENYQKEAAITFLEMVYSEDHIEIIENDEVIEQKA